MRTHASACPAARPSSRSSPRQRPAGPAATVAHGLVGLVLANQTSAATAATLDQHLRATGFPTSPTTARYSQKPARRDRFSVEIWDSSSKDCKWSHLRTACAGGCTLTRRLKGRDNVNSWSGSRQAVTRCVCASRPTRCGNSGFRRIIAVTRGRRAAGSARAPRARAWTAAR